MERQRLLTLYLEQHTRLFSTAVRLLHFAPEQSLHDRFRKARSISYTTCDLRNGPLVDRQIDITNMDLPDATFDVIVCSHVLQEVDEDRKALEELRRVLRPGGIALLQHPIDPVRPVTYEDRSITEPAERHRAFGQADHVRIYGRDFTTRVERAGFHVDVVRLVDQLPDQLVEHCALRDSSHMRSDDVYACLKPSGNGTSDQLRNLFPNAVSSGALQGYPTGIA